MNTVFIVTLSIYVIESTGFILRCPNNNTFAIEWGKTLAPQEVQGLVQNGTIVDTFNSAILALHEQQRRLEIQGFICASCLLRQINADEFEKIKETHPQIKYWRATEIWNWYIEHSDRPAAIRLRGIPKTDEDDEIPGLLTENEYYRCAQSLDVSYKIYCCHLRDNKYTVRVIIQYKDVTNSETIIDMLKKEHGDYLLTEKDMYFNNKLVEALGFKTFPYLTFKDKNGMVFAVPQVRDESDFNFCPLNLCMV